MTRGWKIYWTAASVVAVGLAGWTVLNVTFEIIPPFSDGHGPDAGSLEYFHWQERRRQNLPASATLAALYWMGLSAVVAGLIAGASQIVQRWFNRGGV